MDVCEMWIVEKTFRVDVDGTLKQTSGAHAPFLMDKTPEVRPYNARVDAGCHEPWPHPAALTLGSSRV